MSGSRWVLVTGCYQACVSVLLAHALLRHAFSSKHSVRFVWWHLCGGSHDVLLLFRPHDM
jgi:hypothetical protein